MWLYRGHTGNLYHDGESAGESYFPTFGQNDYIRGAFHFAFVFLHFSFFTPFEYYVKTTGIFYLKKIALLLFIKLDL